MENFRYLKKSFFIVLQKYHYFIIQIRVKIQKLNNKTFIIFMARLSF